MWVEAILARDDFTAFAGELLPLSVHLGAPDSAHYVLLSAATDVALVEGRGLRITCNVQIRWPVLGMDIPIDVQGLTVLLEPSVPEPDGPLLFGVQIEHADVSWIPAIIDAKIVDAINDALRKKSSDLSWTFTKTLSHRFPLPEMLQPIRGLDLSAGWGKVRVTSEAMVLVVSFRALALTEEPLPAAATTALVPAAPRAISSTPPPPIAGPSTKTVAIATTLAVTTAYVMLRGVVSLFTRSPRARGPLAAW